MLHRLHQYRRLAGADRRLLVRAFVSLAVADLALRTHGLHRLLAQVEADTAATPRVRAADELHHARRYARWIDVAARHHFCQATCLRRSLVLHRWLRRDGVPSELRIGVGKAGDAVTAHAWVVLRGAVLNDSPDSVGRFRPLMGAGTAVTKWSARPSRLQTSRERDVGFPIGVGQ